MGRDAKVGPPRHVQKSRPPAWWLSRRVRKRIMVGLVLALIVAGTGAGYTWWSARPGETAAAFALPASTGGTVRLEDYRGKQPVVLVFYMVGT